MQKQDSKKLGSMRLSEFRNHLYKVHIESLLIKSQVFFEENFKKSDLIF